MKEHILEVRKLIQPKYCDKIIKYFSEDLEEAQIGTPTQKVKIDKNTRNCKVKHLLNDETSFGKKLAINYIKTKILEAVSLYTKNNKFLYVSNLSQLDILKYESNSSSAGYSFHVDFAKDASQRAISISICLNNNFSGGEFMFDLNGEKISFTQNVGDCIIFPSNFLFPHQVNKVTSGTRYALVGWMI